MIHFANLKKTDLTKKNNYVKFSSLAVITYISQYYFNTN